MIPGTLAMDSLYVLDKRWSGGMAWRVHIQMKSVKKVCKTLKILRVSTNSDPVLIISILKVYSLFSNYQSFVPRSKKAKKQKKGKAGSAAPSSSLDSDKLKVNMAPKQCFCFLHSFFSFWQKVDMKKKNRWIPWPSFFA